MSFAGLADVTVIICSYTEERWEDLEAAISSVVSQTVRPAEIIMVIDHNPRLLARATHAFDTVRVMENSGQPGLSDARNSGVAAANGSIVAFLDDDAIAQPSWLESLLAPYVDPAVLGVGGAVIPLWSSGRPSWFPEEFDWVVGCSYRGLPTHTSPVRNLLGCNMSFRRTAFDTAGGFDPDIGRVGTRPVGCEETEFCIRLRRMMPDHTLLYVPSAVVCHRVPASRSRWAYFRARCYSEGLSKAIVAGLVGGGDGLAAERRHALVTLPLGVSRSFGRAIRRRDIAGFGQGAAMIGGLAITTAGYVKGRLRRIHRDGPSGAHDRLAVSPTPRPTPLEPRRGPRRGQ